MLLPLCFHILVVEPVPVESESDSDRTLSEEETGFDPDDTYEPTTPIDIVESVLKAHGFEKECLKSLLDASKNRILESQAKLHAEFEAKLAAAVQNIESSIETYKADTHTNIKARVKKLKSSYLDVQKSLDSLRQETQSFNQQYNSQYLEDLQAAHACISELSRECHAFALEAHPSTVVMDASKLPFRIGPEA
ncbi:hypothetical protein L1887_24069 [Cichorium endivia]|nr:hypothetical protein L1887_24069 [Cichorium endivia]